MNLNFTNVSIKLLLINGFVVSIAVMQKIMGWNFFSTSIEAFAYAILASFEIFVIIFYLIAVLSELKGISSSLTNISNKLGE